jgi:hypothetical protein
VSPTSWIGRAKDRLREHRSVGTTSRVEFGFQETRVKAVEVRIPLTGFNRGEFEGVVVLLLRVVGLKLGRNCIQGALQLLPKISVVNGAVGGARDISDVGNGV